MQVPERRQRRCSRFFIDDLNRFTFSYRVSIVNFEQVNASWEDNVNKNDVKTGIKEVDLRQAGK